METLSECVRRVVGLFYPRLGLGISDEMPPTMTLNARGSWASSYRSLLDAHTT